MDVLSIAYLRDVPPIIVALIHVAVIILFAWLLRRISRKLIRTFRTHMEKRAATAENIRRIDTLANVFRYVINLLVTLIASMMILSDSAVVLRCRFKVIPLEQWGVRREFLRRLKEAFEARGIEIPYPHVTIYVGQDKSGIPSAASGCIAIILVSDPH